jgi:hypothetical protein
MAKAVSPRAYFLIVATVFMLMVVVTLGVFLAVERAAKHLPGARPDLAVDGVVGPDAIPSDAPSQPSGPTQDDTSSQ